MIETESLEAVKYGLSLANNVLPDGLHCSHTVRSILDLINRKSGKLFVDRERGVVAFLIDKLHTEQAAWRLFAAPIDSNTPVHDVAELILAILPARTYAVMFDCPCKFNELIIRLKELSDGKKDFYIL